MFAFLTLYAVLAGSDSSSIHGIQQTKLTVRDVRSTTCTDTPDLDCADINRLNSICTKVPDQASYFCPAYCGLCSNGPTVLPSTITTKGSTSETTTIRPTTVTFEQSTATTTGKTTSAYQTSTATTMTLPTIETTEQTDQSTQSSKAMTTTTFHVTSSVTCTDVPRSFVDCPDLDKKMKICERNDSSAWNFCPRFCGMCTPATTATTTTTHRTTTTATTTCTDLPGDIVNCPALDQLLQVCERNDSSALGFCPRYCKICTSEQKMQQRSLNSPSDVRVTTCTDAPDLDCANLNSQNSICTKVPDQAIDLCPSYCGLCSRMTTPRTTVTTTRTYRFKTTSTTCTDLPGDVVNCTGLDQMKNICENDHPSGLLLCPRSCGFCTSVGSTVTNALCVDSELVDCAEMNRTEAICTSWVHINDTLEFCPKYCGLCGGLPTTTNTIITTPTTTTTTTTTPTTITTKTTTTTIPTTITTTTSTTTTKTTTTSNLFCQPSYRLIKGSNGTPAPVSKSSTDSNVETQLQTAFEKHDINLDGVVTTEEFKQLWMEMDTDGDGQVSETEYASSSLRMSPEIFVFLDEDEDCLLSLDNILHFFFNFDLNFDRLIVEGEFMEVHSRIYNFIFQGSV